MDIDLLRKSLAAAEPPAGLGPAARALWWDAKGDWPRAHAAVQGKSHDPDAVWVHAYLHRKEGDLRHAGDWYRRAGRPLATVPLESEWEAIARAVGAGTG